MWGMCVGRPQQQQWTWRRRRDGEDAFDDTMRIDHDDFVKEGSGSYDAGNIEISLEGYAATSSPHMVVVPDIGGFPGDYDGYRPSYNATTTAPSSIRRTAIPPSGGEWLDRTCTNETDDTPVTSNVTRYSLSTAALLGLGECANEDDDAFYGVEGCSM